MVGAPPCPSAFPPPQYRQDTVWTRLSFFYTSTFYVGLTFLLSGVTILMPQRAAFYRCGAANGGEPPTHAVPGGGARIGTLAWGGGCRRSVYDSAPAPNAPTPKLVRGPL